jgi:RNA polymerase sigma factor (sigma-70 family)
MARENLHHLRDDELIGRILQDPSSSDFQELHRRYHQKILDKCFSMVKDRVLAAELAEDVFSKVFEKLPSFKQKASFSSWLYSITYNHCVDYLREKKRMHYPNWSRDNEIPDTIDDMDDVSSQINYENLLKILELVHPEEKAILLMKYQDNLSIKQVSTALRITEAAAKMRLKRAKTRVIYLYTREYLK